MTKVITDAEAAKLIQDGMSVMIGGFLKCGSPRFVIEKLLENGTKNLTIIANDTSFVDSDKGKLVAHKRVRKAIVTHIGMNPETGRQMHDGEIAVELVPQGTLAERIRAGGAGLGGILTPTGVGTVVEKGKQVIEVDGKKYLLEKPLKADIALIYADKADKYGNLGYYGTTRNFNTVMALAGSTVIVEAEEYIDGSLDPNEVVVPGVLVDYIVVKGA